MNRAPEPARSSEPRQRWRITFARDPVARDAVGRAAHDAWQEALVASGLTVVRQGEADHRLRIAFAAPLPAAARGEREWADVWLRDRIAAWELRASLRDRLPPAHEWVDAEDVWLGAPALAAQVAAADWRLDLDAATTVAIEALEAAAAELVAARTIPRIRVKGASEKAYDLRPLLANVRIDGTDGRIAIRARTRFNAELGAGRPDEVVAALADACGAPLAIAATTRTRLLLADDLVTKPRR